MSLCFSDFTTTLVTAVDTSLDDDLSTDDVNVGSDAADDSTSPTKTDEEKNDLEKSHNNENDKMSKHDNESDKHKDDVTSGFTGNTQSKEDKTSMPSHLKTAHTSTMNQTSNSKQNDTYTASKGKNDTYTDNNKTSITTSSGIAAEAAAMAKSMGELSDGKKVGRPSKKDLPLDPNLVSPTNNRKEKSQESNKGLKKSKDKKRKRSDNKDNDNESNQDLKRDENDDYNATKKDTSLTSSTSVSKANPAATKKKRGRSPKKKGGSASNPTSSVKDATTMVNGNNSKSDCEGRRSSSESPTTTNKRKRGRPPKHKKPTEEEKDAKVEDVVLHKEPSIVTPTTARKKKKTEVTEETQDKGNITMEVRNENIEGQKPSSSSPSSTALVSSTSNVDTASEPVETRCEGRKRLARERSKRYRQKKKNVKEKTEMELVIHKKSTGEEKDTVSAKEPSIIPPTRKKKKTEVTEKTQDKANIAMEVGNENIEEQAPSSSTTTPPVSSTSNVNMTSEPVETRCKRRKKLASERSERHQQKKKAETPEERRKRLARERQKRCRQKKKTCHLPGEKQEGDNNSINEESGVGDADKKVNDKHEPNREEETQKDDNSDVDEENDAGDADEKISDTHGSVSEDVANTSIDTVKEKKNEDTSMDDNKKGEGKGELPTTKLSSSNQKRKKRVYIRKDPKDTMHSKRWLQKLQELLAYKSRYGDCDVPQKYPDLGPWVNRQRKSFKANKLSKDKVKMLEDAGFDWYVRGKHRNTSRSYMIGVVGTGNATDNAGTDNTDGTGGVHHRTANHPRYITPQLIKYEENWMKRYEDLKEFKEVHGHTNVKQKSGSLGKWVGCQREQFNLKRKGKPSRLSDDREQLLNALEFEWQLIQRKSWGEGVALKKKSSVVVHRNRTKTKKNDKQDNNNNGGGRDNNEKKDTVSASEETRERKYNELKACEEVHGSTSVKSKNNKVSPEFGGSDSPEQKQGTRDSLDYTANDDETSIAMENTNEWPPLLPQPTIMNTTAITDADRMTDHNNFNLDGPPVLPAVVPYPSPPPPPAASTPSAIAVGVNLNTQGHSFSTIGSNNCGAAFNTGEANFTTNGVNQNIGETNFKLGAPSHHPLPPYPAEAKFRPGRAYFNSGTSVGPNFNAKGANFNPGRVTNISIGESNYDREMNYNADGQSNFNIGKRESHLSTSGANFNAGGENFHTTVNINANEQGLGIPTAEEASTTPRTWNDNTPAPWMNNGGISEAPQAVGWGDNGVVDGAGSNCTDDSLSGMGATHVPHIIIDNKIQDDRRDPEDSNLMQDIAIHPTCATTIQQEQHQQMDAGTLGTGVYVQNTQGEWQGLWGDDTVAIENDAPTAASTNQPQYSQSSQQMRKDSERLAPMWLDFSPPVTHHQPNVSNEQGRDKFGNAASQVSINLSTEHTELSKKEPREKKDPKTSPTAGQANVPERTTKPKPCRKARRKKKNAHPTDLDQPETIWMQRLGSLKKFKEKHGHLMVPTKYEPDTTLGSFVRNQRYQYQRRLQGKPSRLSDEQVHILEEIGFVWQAKEDNGDLWNRMFEALKEYKSIHGNCLLPREYPQNPSLPSWVITQRYQYKLLQNGHKSLMSEERIRLLEGLDFQWTLRERIPYSWQHRYLELKDYKKEHGDCMVPQVYKENEQLGRWVAKQRREYRLWKEGKESTITEKRVKTLELIGFQFENYQKVKRREKISNSICNSTDYDASNGEESVDGDRDDDTNDESVDGAKDKNNEAERFEI